MEKTENLKALIREKDLELKTAKDLIEDLRKQLKAEKLKDKNPWLCVNEHPPKPGTEIIALLDYTKWKRGKQVRQASVHFTEFPRPYGGPNSLCGSGQLKGLYFALPAVCAPGVVTHYKPIPEIN